MAMQQMPGPDGHTRIFATVGDPVTQTVAPSLMSGLFAELGVNALWLPIAAPDAALASVFAAVRDWGNFGGITVTVPHKSASLAFVDQVTRRGLASGAINIVRREPDGTLLGDMVDGTGFVAGLDARGFEVRGKTALLVGAGGAGSAIAAALGEGGVARLAIRDTDAGRVAALEQRLNEHYPAMTIARGGEPDWRYDMAINATPIGMKAGDLLPFDPADLPRDALVCDIIMHPETTALLARAAELGYSTQPGRPMLDHQASLYLDFFGVRKAK